MKNFIMIFLETVDYGKSEVLYKGKIQMEEKGRLSKGNASRWAVVCQRHICKQDDRRKIAEEFCVCILLETMVVYASEGCR